MNLYIGDAINLILFKFGIFIHEILVSLDNMNGWQYCDFNETCY